MVRTAKVLMREVEEYGKGTRGGGRHKRRRGEERAYSLRPSPTGFFRVSSSSMRSTDISTRPCKVKLVCMSGA